MINKLLGQELLKTKEISAQTRKGKHTTTHRELYVLKNGGMVIDNPGMREVRLAALGSGELGANKYENYLKLKKEADYHALTKTEKKNKDRSFGRMVKVYKEQKKKLK